MVHTFRLNGFNFAVDGNSGSIHMLDDLSFKMLSGTEELMPLDEAAERFKGEYSYEEIKEAYDEIKSLKNQGLLFSPLQVVENMFPAKEDPAREGHTAEEELAEEEPAKRELAKDDTAKVGTVKDINAKADTVKESSKFLKSLCLHVSHDCNLNCEYCFASKGDYKSGCSLMTEEVALRAVDYLVENSGSRCNIEIDFFGGEPLLNFDTVVKAVDYGKSLENKTGKRFYFTITTNGVLLDDEKINFINKYMDNVVISIDGRKEIHDSIRTDRAGKGTYDKIIPLAKKLVALRDGKSYFIRGTFTSRNKDFSNDVKHLAGLGFKEISIEPVVGSGDALFIKEQDVPGILGEYEELAVEYLKLLQQGNSFRFYHFNLNLYEGPCVYKRIAACGAGSEYFAVSPEGYLYPCHQFVGQKEFIMGDIFNGIGENPGTAGLRKMFKENNILTKEKCMDCWAKLYCSGGCHANAWYSNRDISKPNEIACTLQKKRIECAIMIQAAIMLLTH